MKPCSIYFKNKNKVSASQQYDFENFSTMHLPVASAQNLSKKSYNSAQQPGPFWYINFYRYSS